MTFRISKYRHNAWKAPQQHKNPQVLPLRRNSYPNMFLIIFTSLGIVLSFRFFAKKLITENVLIHENV